MLLSLLFGWRGEVEENSQLCVSHGGVEPRSLLTVSLAFVRQGGRDDIVVCETPFGGLNLGLSVCFDLRFPLLYSRLRAATPGANAMVIPAAFTVGI